MAAVGPQPRPLGGSAPPCSCMSPPPTITPALCWSCLIPRAQRGAAPCIGDLVSTLGGYKGLEATRGAPGLGSPHPLAPTAGDGCGGWGRGWHSVTALQLFHQYSMPLDGI